MLAGCLINSKYHKANDLYQRKNYVKAIELYDKFIKENPQSPYTTKSRLERSQAYLALAKRAYTKENWVLAKRLFILANSDKADSFLDNCFYEIGSNKLAQKDTLAALENFDYIVNNLSNSELLPEILFKRIELNFSMKNYSQISSNYKRLWDNYPDSEYAQKAVPYIDKILPSYLKKIKTMISEKDYNEALDNLTELLSFPSSLQTEIKSLMAKTYYLKAETAYEQGDLKNAMQFYQKSGKQTDEFSKKVDNRIAKICDLYIEEGDQLMQAEHFDQAITVYEKIFIFQPDNQHAKEKISTAENLHYKKKEAEKILAKADEAEKAANFTKALELYKKSNNLHQSKHAKQQIFEINNILRADKEPKIFAKDIIFEYNDGNLVKNVYALQDSLTLKHGKDEVRTSEWKVLYSFGKYKYEIRYDILTPDNNFYFIWQIDLKQRKVSALNKLSENML
jgi:tetratricopeptide (TPR) repeat protein